MEILKKYFSFLFIQQHNTLLQDKSKNCLMLLLQLLTQNTANPIFKGWNEKGIVKIAINFWQNYRFEIYSKYKI